MTGEADQHQVAKELQNLTMPLSEIGNNQNADATADAVENSSNNEGIVRQVEGKEVLWKLRQMLMILIIFSIIQV
jgi:hypothetical protein